jgi:hypothetical protein
MTRNTFTEQEYISMIAVKAVVTLRPDYLVNIFTDAR